MICALIFSLYSGTIQAQAVHVGPDAGALSRTLEDDLMRLEREREDRRQREGGEYLQRTSPDEEAQKQLPAQTPRVGALPSLDVEPVWSLDKPVPDEEVLAASIGSVFVESPCFNSEIDALAKKTFYQKEKITQQEIIKLRRDIWDLFLQSGRLAHVTVSVVPQGGIGSPSVLILKIQEIGVRQVLIEDPKGKTLSQATRESIKSDIMRAFSRGDIINLIEMDAKIQHRLRLGDYAIRLALIPVTPTLMDVKAVMTEHPDQEIQSLVRYDNNGMRSFGRDRFLGSVLAHQVAFPGDRLSGLLLKTGDIFHTELGSGVLFGRVDYEVPVSAWGVRLAGWASAMHYNAIKEVTADSTSQGESFELGVGVLRPLVTGKDHVSDGRVDWLMKFQTDRFDEDIELSNKMAYEIRAQVKHDQKIAQDMQVQADAALVFGAFDLSGNSSSYQQDKDGADVNGPFAKVTANAKWFKGTGKIDSFDFSTALKAQAAVKNLDSMEKISLGGENGLRGFGSGEAMGDHGGIFQAETGYILPGGMRFGVFYDVGWVQRYVTSFTNDGVPLSYVLQDAGAGLEAVYQGFQIKTTFAHQIGDNPGLTSSGTDSENVKKAYRLWVSLSMQF
ncbi:MAG: ShlB/FhaC/HecB family hemolysin secretion/activation protein [Alphaproteobacteria bacterium]|nr:ShlB/FhaC/HecB family hemolysin secretion/activation protein [Alphaproteobacteria bacterium]